MLRRDEARAAIARAMRRSPVALLLGPRQCGKTTLARSFVDVGSEAYFDLESPGDLARLAEPMTALGNLRGTVVIDEVQRRPDLFPVLRVLADRRPLRTRFLVLGSASPHMLRQSSESLAGRVELIELGPLTLEECGQAKLGQRWLRGGFPARFWRVRKATARRGAVTSSPPSSNAICARTTAGCRRRWLTGSGSCWLITMARSSTSARWPGHWGSPFPPCVTTSTCWQVSW